MFEKFKMGEQFAVIADKNINIVADKNINTTVIKRYRKSLSQHPTRVSSSYLKKHNNWKLPVTTSCVLRSSMLASWSRGYPQANICPNFHLN